MADILTKESMAWLPIQPRQMSPVDLRAYLGRIKVCEWDHPDKLEDHNLGGGSR